MPFTEEQWKSLDELAADAIRRHREGLDALEAALERRDANNALGISRQITTSCAGLMVSAHMLAGDTATPEDAIIADSAQLVRDTLRDSPNLAKRASAVFVAVLLADEEIQLEFWQNAHSKRAGAFGATLRSLTTQAFGEPISARDYEDEN